MAVSAGIRSGFAKCCRIFVDSLEYLTDVMVSWCLWRISFRENRKDRVKQWRAFSVV
jgi:hypothetical protein